MLKPAVDLAREPEFSLGGLTVRPSTREIISDDGVEVLEPRIMQVLVVLAQSRGAVVSREELLERCWQGRVVGEDALHRCISRLRRLAEPHKPFEIDTIARVGFRLQVAEARPGVGTPTEPDADGRSHKIEWRSAKLQVVAGLLVLVGAFAALAWMAVAGNTGRSHSTEPERSYRGLKSFSDCREGCPEMVALPPGQLELTPTPQDPWGPPRTITFSKGFAIGRYDVTRAEYALFVKEAGYRPTLRNCFTITKAGEMQESHGDWSNPGFAQTDRDPAVCISWDDANAYTAWLSRRTGAAYRLPTETEWTYAAGPARVLTGNPGSLLCNRLNGADRDYHARFPGDPAVDQRCSDNYAFTSPVGTFPPNIYGLYDILGDVWQWMQDCYSERPLSTPLDGGPSLMTPCSERVVRGGSWSDDLKKIRLTRRDMGSPADRFPQNGLRVARDL